MNSNSKSNGFGNGSLLTGPHNDSLVNGTNDREACPKRWIAVLVKMNTEKKVSEQLNKLNIENYVPTQIEIHQWSDRKKKVNRIVIPMVVFVYLSEEEEKQLLKYSFILKILSYPGQKGTAIIPEDQIERLKYMLKHADSKVELTNNVYKLGGKVQIARGPLKNLIGELCYVEQNKSMVAIRIESLGFACVNISKSDVISI